MIRKQKALIIKEDRNIELVDLKIERKGYILNTKKNSRDAWHLVPKLLMRIKEPDSIGKVIKEFLISTGLGVKRSNLILLLNERDFIPCDPFNILNKSEIERLNNPSAIARETIHLQKQKVEDKRDRESFYYPIVGLAGIAGLVVVAASIMVMTGVVNV